MLHVTSDLETELYRLEQRRLDLIKRRDEIIEQAESMIRGANRHFDTVAIPLGRQINELRERLKKDEQTADTPTRQRRQAIPLDGLDDEDQAHYQELLARKKKR